MSKISAVMPACLSVRLVRCVVQSLTAVPRRSFDHSQSLPEVDLWLSTVNPMISVEICWGTEMPSPHLAHGPILPYPPYIKFHNTGRLTGLVSVFIQILSRLTHYPEEALAPVMGKLTRPFNNRLLTYVPPPCLQHRICTRKRRFCTVSVRSLHLPPCGRQCALIEKTAPKPSSYRR